MNPFPILKIYGERPDEEEHFLGLILERNLTALARIDRDFVAIVGLPGKDIIVTSGSGVQPYFVGRTAKGDAHGRTVGDVVAQISDVWDWDYAALAEYLSVALVTDNRTFHRAVRRVQRGRFVVFRAGRISEDIGYVTSPFEITIADGRRDAGDLISELLDGVGEITEWDSHLFLSASGGFDARLLLAALLKFGIPVQLLVSGTARSTDCTLVSAIAEKFALNLRAITLEADEFLRYFISIARATGGGLAIDHWYGFLHLSRITDPETTVLMGVGGEVCRSHYFDRGLASMLLNCGPWPQRSAVLRRRLEQRGSVNADHIQHLTPLLAAELRPEALTARAGRHAQLASRGMSDWMDGLDRFFVEQEIAYEQGMQLLGTEQVYRGEVINPFTRGRFILGARGLSRRLKLGSRFHRIAINKLQPGLMKFPEYGFSYPMRSTPMPLYWLQQCSHSAVSYVDTALFESDDFDNLFKANAHELSSLVSSELILRLSNRQSRLPSDARLFWTLLPLAVFLAQFRQNGGRQV